MTHYETAIQTLDQFQGYDLIVAADGLNSLVRRNFEGDFGLSISYSSNKFAWYGTTKTFATLSQTFVATELGAFNAHHYRYSPQMSTFLVECDGATWQALREVVTAIDSRKAITGQLERRDGNVVDCTTVPLPGGATLVTFHDVTDSVNVERVLRERNDALEEADRLKIDFVHHVSYELRSPLTNIIGFVHLLGDAATGPLESKQREYLEYITVSSDTLLALINNILDLATIDAGRMQLNLEPVGIREAMQAAAEGVQDRLVSAGLTLDIRAGADIGSFVADGRRVRQILFNLLANAVSFSPGGATVTLAAERREGEVTFSVTDTGPGIPPDMLERVFNWFETHPLGSHHRGPGIGLSLVRSFVELHGGTVAIASVVGQGTTVTCGFPTSTAAARTAA